MAETVRGREHIAAFNDLMKDLNDHVKKMDKTDFEDELSNYAHESEVIVLKIRRIAPFLHEDMYCVEDKNRRRIRDM